ncbi:type IV pilin protein [Pseudomonadota bacterium]
MREKGFTLVELMITVAIIAILAMVAIPAFQDQIYKARRSDGRAALLDLQSEMEKFRGSCRFYPQNFHATADSCSTSAALSTINYAGTTTPTSPDGYYNLTIVATTATGNAYTIRATPTGAQAADSCTQMDIVVSTASPKGNKTGTGTGCW